MQSDDIILDWLQLARTQKIGPIQFFGLLERFGTVKDALKWLQTPDGSAHSQIANISKRDDAKREFEQTKQIGAEIITFESQNYPPMLKEIPDPPPIITYLGNIEFAHNKAVSIVGARNASGNGRKLACQLAIGVSQSEITVISGLARGIDTSAHQGGLLGAGSTVAVIASGIDIAYPAENTHLMAEIAQKGAIVTERPLGAAPQARYFPRRNRIISGLSQAIVVVEAAERSGSLMTARLGLDHGREVMAVPGSPMDPRHRGTNKLLRDGAQMVEEVSDILENIPEYLRLPLPKPKPQIRKFEPKKFIAAKQAKAVKKSSDDEMQCLLVKLEELLSPEPLLVDEVIRRCHASAGDVQSVLLQLELDGRISRHPGNRVALEIS